LDRDPKQIHATIAPSSVSPQNGFKNFKSTGVFFRHKIRFRLWDFEICRLKIKISKFHINQSTGNTSSSPKIYLLNHCQLCQTAANRSLGLVIP
jgi:hypothetical protein